MSQVFDLGEMMKEEAKRAQKEAREIKKDAYMKLASIVARMTYQLEAAKEDEGIRGEFYEGARGALDELGRRMVSLLMKEFNISREQLAHELLDDLLGKTRTKRG